MKKIICLLFVLSLTQAILAHPRTTEELKNIAADFFNKQRSSGKRKINRVIKNMEPKLLIIKNNVVLANIEDVGFIIMSKDDSSKPILGYSDGVYTEDYPPAFMWWLESIDASLANKAGIESLVPSEYKSHVDPLIKTKWNQWAPYNNLCPYEKDSRCPTGCTNTAIAQIMNYYKFPEHGIGSHSYEFVHEDGTWTNLEFDYENTKFDWDNMLDNYTGYWDNTGNYIFNCTDEQENAVATLMYACGIMNHTAYHSNGSPAALLEVNLMDIFRYYCEWKLRQDYDNKDWMNLIYSNLSSGKPIYYGGKPYSGSAHAFILDGYDSEGLVHVNFGWGGQADGFYDIYNNDISGFNYYQNAYFNITPHPVPVRHEITLTAPGTLSEKMGNELVLATTDTLKINGSLNGTDILCLRNWLRNKYLRHLDLSDAYIIKGGESYYDDRYITENDMIPEYAFTYCPLRTISLPRSIKAVGKSAFSDCNQLIEVDIKEGTSVIGEYAFHSCDDLKLVTLPNSLKKIETGAFWGCQELTTIDLKNTEVIGIAAFAECGLISINIPQSLTSIENPAFRNCINLNTIVVDNKNTIYDSRNNCNAIIETATNTLITGCKTTLIPNSVTTIGRYAFQECEGLTSITIPESIISINAYSFQNCVHLKSIFIPRNVQEIGYLSFCGCSGLETIVVDSKNKYYDSRNNCNAIIKNNWGITTLIQGCQNTIIPNDIVSIYYGAFQGCKFKNINIPNGVKYINPAAFKNCEALDSITIPSSVVGIDNLAFNGCPQLHTVISYIEKPFEIQKTVFARDYYWNDEYDGAKVLYVPRGTKELYESTNYWNLFNKIIEFDPVDDTNDISEISMQKGTGVSYYDIVGRKTSSVRRGINIIKMSDGTVKKLMIK